MCGIGGVFDLSTKSINQKLSEQNLLKTKFLKTLKKRGPDGRGFFVSQNGDLLFVHTRLAITDESQTGGQPMLSRCKNYLIIFNGEIYNFLELQKKYLYDFSFKSSSDTEVLLELFVKIGPSVFQELEGIFAFAVFDINKEQLFLCKDHLGIKPLYFLHDKLNQTLFFSSHAKFLAQITNSPVTDECNNLFVSYGCIPGNKTVFKNIENFPAGSYLIFAKNNFQIIKYHCAKDYLENISQQNLDKSVITIFEEVLISQLPKNNIPLGLFLSSGLDSNFIASLLFKNKIPFHTFTIGFLNDTTDIKSEANEARKFALKWGSMHHEWILSKKELEQNYLEFQQIIDQPTTDGFNVFLASKLAAPFCKVVLSGLGADELLFGYWHFNHIKNWIKLQKYSWFLNVLYFFTKKISHYSLIKSILFHSGYFFLTSEKKLIDLKDIYFFFRKIKSSESTMSSFFNPEISEINDIFNSTDFSSLQKISLVELYFYDQYKLLRDCDSFSMNFGVEVRVPFLDKRILNFIFSKNNFQASYELFNKTILKEYFKEKFNDLVFNKKQGFEVPLF